MNGKRLTKGIYRTDVSIEGALQGQADLIELSFKKDSGVMFDTDAHLCERILQMENIKIM